jgi:hypothetical protein
LVKALAGRSPPKIIAKKGLDFGRNQSVTADDARVLIARDPAPPAARLLRGFGGDGTKCRHSAKKGSQYGKQQDQDRQETQSSLGWQA